MKKQYIKYVEDLIKVRGLEAMTYDRFKILNSKVVNPDIECLMDQLAPKVTEDGKRILSEVLAKFGIEPEPNDPKKLEMYKSIIVK